MSYAGPTGSGEVALQPTAYNPNTTTGGGYAPSAYTAQPNVAVPPVQSNAPGVNIFLKPIAAPSAFGWAAFFASTWVLQTWLASWYGSDFSAPSLWPFIMIFGGVGQFLAGLFCYPARDNLGTVFHTSWGSFYIAYGIYQQAQQVGSISGGNFLLRHDTQAELAMWLVVMAAITLICLLASVGRDVVVVALLFMLFVGTVLQFAGYFYSSTTKDHTRRLVKAGAYFSGLAALIALYRCLAYLVEENFLGTFLPVIQSKFEKEKPLVRIPIGEPGIKRGQ